MSLDIATYASWFRNSTPYIRAHRGKTFVVFLTGEALEHANLVNIIHDLALLQVLGVRLVLVHGARPQLANSLPDAKFHGPRRITELGHLDPLLATYGQLRTRIEGLFATGLPNTPLHGTNIRVKGGNFVTAKPIGVIDGVDHQFTGSPSEVHKDQIEAALDQGALVLLSPVGYSSDGQAYNLAADELVSTVAVALGADKLLMLDHQGYLADDQGELSTLLAPDDLKSHLDGEHVTDAQRGHLLALITAVRGGVPRAHVVSFEEDGALLGELFTTTGRGTQISEEQQTPIRPATVADIAGIIEIIRPLEEQGALVRRPRDKLEAEIDHFVVAELDNIVIGCCALYPFPGTHAAEVGCVAVHASYRQSNSRQRTSIGQRLLQHAESLAAAKSINEIFLLTTGAEDWFAEQGFERVSVESLPAPKQALYNHQRNSKVMRKTL